MPNAQRSKYWVFTLNNYTPEEKENICSAYLDGGNVIYVCAGYEVGESGTPHIQGYIEFSKKKRLRGVKNIIGSRCHLEVRRGTQQEAIDYCKKDGEFEEFGSPVVCNQGKRNDLLEVKAMLDEGKSELEVADKYFGSWVRYRKSFKSYTNLKQINCSRDVKVFVLYGNPGTGKTRYVFEKHPDVWICNDPTLQWFDGYGGEKVVCLDDYRGNGNESFILRLLDRYPMKVPIKGSFVPWVPDIIYITSNISPPFGHIDIEGPLMRRITKSFHLIQVVDFEDPTAIQQIDGHFV